MYKSQSLTIYRYVHLSLPVNLSANIIVNFHKPQDKSLRTVINHTMLESLRMQDGCSGGSASLYRARATLCPVTVSSNVNPSIEKQIERFNNLYSG